MSPLALIMLAAGFCVPLLAALNAALGQSIGSPSTAAFVLFCVATVTAGIVLMVTGASNISDVLAAPRHLLLGGALIAFYVLSITYIAPKFGVGNAVFFVLLGQLISAAAIDHFGLFNTQISPLSLTRAVGISVMAIGVWITQLA